MSYRRQRHYRTYRDPQPDFDFGTGCVWFLGGMATMILIAVLLILLGRIS